jgi:predicted dehydrogenase
LRTETGCSFDPTFRRLKTAIEKGEVGDVHMIHIISRDPSPPPLAYIAQSGGLHCDMAVRPWTFSFQHREGDRSRMPAQA